MEQRAQALALRLADELGLEGLLAVEMFLTKEGSLLINELAPAPHNSYHASERACVTSQFEQAVRAVCDLPLGDVSVVQPAAIANLLGDVWLKGNPQIRSGAWPCRESGLHLYEKHQPRKGRKDGPSYQRLELRRTRQLREFSRRSGFCNSNCDRNAKGRPSGLPFVTVTDTVSRYLRSSSPDTSSLPA